MSLDTEKPEIKRKLEQRAEADRIQELYNSKLWQEIAFPAIEEIFQEGWDFIFDLGDKGQEARMICKTVMRFASKIGIKYDIGQKAKDFLEKKFKNG